MTLARRDFLAAVGIGSAFLTACSSTNKETPQNTKMKSQPFGSTRSGEPVELYTLRNYKGMEATIMTYGGTVVTLKVPDRASKFDDVVLGFDSLDDYVKDPPPPFFGALIGRYGNRIGKAKFTLDGVEYKLAQNRSEEH